MQKQSQYKKPNQTQEGSKLTKLSEQELHKVVGGLLQSDQATIGQTADPRNPKLVNPYPNP